MNTSNNYADFVDLDLNSENEYEPYGYQQGLPHVPFSKETPDEAVIENILLNHTKYHVYWE